MAGLSRMEQAEGKEIERCCVHQKGKKFPQTPTRLFSREPKISSTNPSRQYARSGVAKDGVMTNFFEVARGEANRQSHVKTIKYISAVARQHTKLCDKKFFRSILFCIIINKSRLPHKSFYYRTLSNYRCHHAHYKCGCDWLWRFDYIIHYPRSCQNQTPLLCSHS